MGLRATCPEEELTETTTVIIDSNAPDQIVTVTLSCSGDPILGEINPNPLELIGQTSSSTASSFTLENLGGADLSYSLSSNKSWLSVSPASGVIDASSAQLINVNATCPVLAGAQNATLTITSNDTTQPSTTLDVILNCTSSTVSAYSVQLQFVGTLSAAQKNAAENAAARWSKIIIGDLPNENFSKAYNICGIGDPEINGIIDDLMIAIVVGPIDGEGKIFADAGPAPCV